MFYVPSIRVVVTSMFGAQYNYMGSDLVVSLLLCPVHSSTCIPSAATESDVSQVNHIHIASSKQDLVCSYVESYWGVICV